MRALPTLGGTLWCAYSQLLGKLLSIFVKAISTMDIHFSRQSGINAYNKHHDSAQKK
jgi:hypothetical protein